MLGALIILNKLTADAVVPTVLGLWVITTGIRNFVRAWERIEERKHDFYDHLVIGLLNLVCGLYVFFEMCIRDSYMGVKLQTENMSFSNLLTALNKGQFDIVLADIEATDERKEAADFSDPYLTEPAPHFLVKKENADQYKTYADFEGKTIGAQTATTKLKIISEIPNVNAVSLQSVLDLIKEVSYGKVDAILVDGSVAQQYQETNDDLVALTFDELGSSAEVCVAVAKGDPKGLLPKINEAIAKLTEENKIEEFKANAAALADVLQEAVSYTHLPEDGTRRWLRTSSQKETASTLSTYIRR